MKKLGILALGLLAVASLAAASGPWAIVTNPTQATINIVDLGATPPIVYGPFLHSHLGSDGGGLFDVAVTPDGKTALLTNFGDMALHKVDISVPTNPVIKDTLQITEMFLEDVVISRDGQYAVISDGGFSSKLVFVKLNNIKKYDMYEIKKGQAQCVALAPDNTLVMADYWDNRIVYGKVNDARTGLVSENKLTIDGRPLNAAISPDGTTVAVVANENWKVYFLKLSNGVITMGTSIKVSGFPQSVAFSPDGTKAYVRSSDTRVDKTDMFTWFNITGPGQATLGGSVGIPTTGGSALFGVDTISVTPDGTKALIGFQTMSIGEYPDKKMPLINLVSHTWSTITLAALPCGVACFDPATGFGSPFPPVDAGISRFFNTLTSYGESVNHLTWKANPQNLSTVAGYRIYAKIKNAPDSAYALLAEVPANVFVYNDRGLDPNAQYRYRITAVNILNKESQPVEIGN